MTTIEATHASADKAIDQASEFPEANLFDLDLALQEGLARAHAAWGTHQVHDLGALAGQAFTEKQGGSDLRCITTSAAPADDGSYLLRGHKWFCSAPMCDIFLTIAKTDVGLSCFLVERGAGFHIMRLKDKLGTCSLPSAEIEFHDGRAG